ncbi:flagellar hook assembly protein FlgD [Pseudomonas sichuanensis]|uniref:flagellar hook assembly protein FlgD n=1 Tax=Pseudomonas TaxID=286 RepID=UPI00129B6A57|nr:MULTISPECIES: flagellar hook assembly protein FlgD [Pseudomonas]MDH0729457.1 flagellar hook assembly protein FlgD [Pseudomonas sichuanensis]MDH1581432.1 flagellar hook assembly protein FlgD [Pseudomonas sichuanensis]MDH1590794.1 flagellar hook assembly protein FlgD [Pseudomonas sichuanensis]MDH1596009.1 flagellar hook assembly protein FlgD [Pseudomonas sichuanensis]MDU9401762.1 flagellar hook assembly protein FlgD [Pseudomonas sp. zfem004]
MTTTNTSNDVGSAYLKSLQKTDSKNSSTTGQAGSALGKDAFLQLLVTQMKNQNPLDPQENGEFVAQLAQFSSLEGIQSLNDSVNGILTGIGSSQALQATSLVGRSVIVQTDKAVVDTTSSFNGQVVVPQSISDGKVTIKDKDGNVVKTIQLGSQKAGTADFIWDGTNEKGEKVAPGTYTFAAETTVEGKAKTLSTLLPARVNSVSFQNGSEMMLDLAGIGKIGISKVTSIGI